MQNKTPDTETLNAYVDGELDKDVAADVARAVASDPVVAQKVATLTDLRSALVESVDASDLELDDLVPNDDAQPDGCLEVKLAGRRRRRQIWFAVAACLAGLLVIGSFLYRDLDSSVGPGAWVTPVLAAHDLWSLEDASADTASLQSADFFSSELARSVYVPDLTSARLKMAYVNPRYLVDGVEFFVAGYAGTRGCKITMVARSATGLIDSSMREVGIPGLRAIAWNAGPLDYILMAQGMDEKRFELIAATVRESSLNHQPVSSETRVALGASREVSAPCSA